MLVDLQEYRSCRVHLLSTNRQQSIFATEDHRLHRNRRAALSSFFSKASISKLEPLIHERAQRLCDKFLQEAGRDKPIDISMAYSCFTTDVIIAYCFGQTQGFLDNEGFEKNLQAALHAGCSILPVTKQWPGILVIVDTLPELV
jgi:cytochrome P450